MVDVVSLVVLGVFLFVLGVAAGGRKGRRDDPRLDEAWQHVASLRAALSSAAGREAAARRELGHRRLVVVDRVGGKMFAECSVCGLDMGTARVLGLSERCAGVRFTDKEWSAALERKATPGKELAS